jgi:hypothetical protein
MQFVKAPKPHMFGTTRNPVRNLPRSSCEKTRGGSGQTGIRTRAHTRMAEFKAIPRPREAGGISLGLQLQSHIHDKKEKGHATLNLEACKEAHPNSK